MPSTVIDVRTSYSPAQEVAIIEAVQSALVQAFKIPLQDRSITLVAHLPHRMITPPALQQPERYTVVRIDAFAGRSIDAKRNLYQAMVNSLQPLGIPADHVKVCLREIPTENWGIQGGQAASDVDLGFQINV
jgi:phenylpyruvate tautomerase PptA (4-oxalocrotonate tautomerase family)